MLFYRIRQNRKTASFSAECGVLIATAVWTQHSELSPLYGQWLQQSKANDRQNFRYVRNVSYDSQHYIAGELPNNAVNLARWLQNPQEIEPDTAMPNLGVSYQEAMDTVAYFYAR